VRDHNNQSRMKNVIGRFAMTLAALLAVVATSNQEAFAQGAVYSCQGFDSPFNVPVALAKKANRAIPLKAKLFDTLNNPVTSSTLTGLTPPVVNVSFSSTTTPAVDETSLLAPLGSSSSGNQFNFDASTDTWWFNLGTTPFTAPGTYTVSLQSGDTTQYAIANSCSAACQANYNHNVNFCQTNYDPSACGTNTVCQQIVFQEQADCIGASVNALLTCSASCTETGSQCSGQFVRP